MFNAIEIIDCLFNPNNNLFFNFSRSSARVGHIDIDVVYRYRREYFFTDIRRAHYTANQSQHHE